MLKEPLYSYTFNKILIKCMQKKPVPLRENETGENQKTLPSVNKIITTM